MRCIVVIFPAVPTLSFLQDEELFSFTGVSGTVMTAGSEESSRRREWNSGSRSDEAT
jgi:hypothetical protein